jgi:hypothetical protein
MVVAEDGTVGGHARRVGSARAIRAGRSAHGAPAAIVVAAAGTVTDAIAAAQVLSAVAATGARQTRLVARTAAAVQSASASIRSGAAVNAQGVARGRGAVALVVGAGAARACSALEHDGAAVGDRSARSPELCAALGGARVSAAMVGAGSSADLAASTGAAGDCPAAAIRSAAALRPELCARLRLTTRWTIARATVGDLCILRAVHRSIVARMDRRIRRCTFVLGATGHERTGQHAAKRKSWQLEARSEGGHVSMIPCCALPTVFPGWGPSPTSFAGVI